MAGIQQIGARLWTASLSITETRLQSCCIFKLMLVAYKQAPSMEPTVLVEKLLAIRECIMIITHLDVASAFEHLKIA